jgi:hypothetical protein
MRKFLLGLSVLVVALVAGGFHQWSPVVHAAAKVKPYIAVSPDPVVAPSSFTLSGCAYKPGDAYVVVWHNPATGGYSGPGTLGYTAEPVVDANGCITADFTTTAWGSDLASQQGDYEVTVSQDRGSIGVNYLVYVFHVE